MEKINVEYKSKYITDNTILTCDGYSSVSFENVGTDNALLMDCIPLKKNDTIREFINLPGQIIKTPIKVTFSNQSLDKAILVVFTYYS